jgi:glycosyltransferase involved in cell wall biosynthesis
VGRQALALGPQLAGLPDRLALEVRCTVEARPLLERAFPPGTRFHTPLRRSRPRLVRLLYQQLVAPLRDPADVLLVCLGDQAPLFGRARRVLVVNDVRRLVRPRSAGRLEGALYRFLVPRAARRAHTLLTISEFSAAEIEQVLGLRARVVAHRLPRPRGVTPHSDGSHVLAVGADRPYKGLDTLRDALAQLDSGPPLVLAGADAAGWVDDDRLAGLYAGALVTVSPSRYEGYGLGVAESLLHARPTIASDIPPHREIGRDAVLYFPPGDAAALAGLLAGVVADGALRGRLAAAAAARADELEHEGVGWREAILDAARTPRGR